MELLARFALTLFRELPRIGSERPRIEPQALTLVATTAERVAARAAELLAQEMTLRELRKAQHLTQARLGRQLKMAQDGVSRLEKRSDLFLSTLRKTIEAMGCDLSLIANFPGRTPVVISGLQGLVTRVRRRKRLSIARRERSVSAGNRVGPDTLNVGEASSQIRRSQNRREHYSARIEFPDDRFGLASLLS